MKCSLVRYKIYEYIRDTDKISEKSSNTKRIISELVKGNEDILNYCKSKQKEELREVNDAKEGRHFHENMTKREILVNEISQYIYWQTLIAVSKKETYEEFSEEEKIRELLKDVSLSKIDSNDEITVKEVIEHDLLDMCHKDYLKEMIESDYTFD